MNVSQGYYVTSIKLINPLNIYGTKIEQIFDMTNSALNTTTIEHHLLPRQASISKFQISSHNDVNPPAHCFSEVD